MVRLENLWTFEGPSAEALELLRANGGHLSSGETLLLMAAFDFWNGQGGCTLHRMLELLDHDRLEAICALALALSTGSTPPRAHLASTRVGHAHRRLLLSEQLRTEHPFVSRRIAGGTTDVLYSGIASNWPFASTLRVAGKSPPVRS